MEDFTGAEIQQMWAERMRTDWQHTALIISYLLEVNKSKKSQKINPNDYNPMEQGNKPATKGIPLSSPEGFLALSQVAKSWRPK